LSSGKIARFHMGDGVNGQHPPWQQQHTHVARHVTPLLSICPDRMYAHGLGLSCPSSYILVVVGSKPKSMKIFLWTFKKFYMFIKFEFIFLSHLSLSFCHMEVILNELGARTLQVPKWVFSWITVSDETETRPLFSRLGKVNSGRQN
jgi:hypothetical protein